MMEATIDSTPIGQVSQKIKLMEHKIRQNEISSLRSTPYQNKVKPRWRPQDPLASRSSVLGEAPSEQIKGVPYQIPMMSTPKSHRRLCQSQERPELHPWQRKKVFRTPGISRMIPKTKPLKKLIT